MTWSLGMYKIYKSNAVVYVTPFLIGQYQIITGISYMIDASNSLCVQKQYTVEFVYKEVHGTLDLSSL